MARNYASPGVDFQETEKVALYEGPNTTATAVVGGANKGPLTITEISSKSLLNKTFGYDSIAVKSAEVVLEKSRKVYFQRVIPELSTKTAKGVAGVVATDCFVWETPTLDSTLNGYVINVVVTAGAVSISIYNGPTLLESFGQMSLVSTDANYVLSVFNKRSNLFVMSRTAVPYPEGGYTGGVFTVRDGKDGIADLDAIDYIGSSTRGGIRSFYNVEAIDIFTLIVPGVTDSEVILEMNALTLERKDIMCVPDIPDNLSMIAANDWVNATGVYTTNPRLDNSYMAFYYPWVERYNYETKEYEFLPPSAFAVAQYCLNDASSRCWFAPAGFDRGLLKTATSLRHDMSKEERDLVYGGTSVINPIINHRTKGIIIMGNKTTKRPILDEDESPLCSVNVRRLCNYIRKFTIDISLTELFNPNDSYTWESWRLKILPRMRLLQENRGLTDFRVIMDETTVTEEAIQRKEMPGVIWVKPVLATEYIPISFIVTEDSVLFTN